MIESKLYEILDSASTSERVNLFLNDSGKTLRQVMEGWQELFLILQQAHDVPPPNENTLQQEQAVHLRHKAKQKEIILISFWLDGLANTQGLYQGGKLHEAASEWCKLKYPDHEKMRRATENLALYFGEIVNYADSLERGITPTLRAPQCWITSKDAATEYQEVMGEYSDGITLGSAKKQICLACNHGQIECVGTRLKRRINPLSLNAWIQSKRKVLLDASDNG